MSFAVSSALAGLAQESRAVRNRIMRNGQRFILNEESRRNVHGSSRMRVFSINALGQLEKLT
jgi:hypothetical protein